MARGIQALLEDHPRIRVTAIAASVREAREMARAEPPDVTVMDYRLPDGSGAEAAKAIREQTDSQVVFLSAEATRDTVAEAVEAGACGYFLKSDAPELLVDGVLRAAEGEILIPAAVLRDLINYKDSRRREDRERARLVGLLTVREHEVLGIMARGLDNQSIAEALAVTLTTARTHVRNILSKLDAHSKLEAVARAAELGLLGD